MKKFDLQSKVCDAVKKVSAYAPGEQPKDNGWVKLNTNEFPYPPSPRVKDAIVAELGVDAACLRLYPDPLSSKFRAAVAERFGVPIEYTIAANGSDDLLNLAMRSFTDGKLSAVTIEPSYSLYPVLSKIQGANLIRIPFGKNMEIDFDKIFNSGANIFFLTNPNAPTGVGFPISVLEKIAENFNGIVLVDEAYAPFAEYSAAKLALKYENVLVAGTSSKGWGMAGMRVGWGIANPAIIEILERVRDSYNLDRLAQAAGIAALKDVEYYSKLCAAVKSERDEVQKFFDKLGWDYHKSSANFIFFKPKLNGSTGISAARSLFEFLRSKKILLRYFAKDASVNDGIRLTIGTPEQMTIFKTAASEWSTSR